MISATYLPALLAGVISLLSPYFWRPFLLRLGAFDVPNHRSSHTRKTLRGGGIGALSGILVATPFLSVFGGEAVSGSPIVIIFITAISIGMVGFVEDLKGLKSSTRALLQIIIGLGLSITLTQHFEATWWWVPAITIFFAAHVNFTNFMDGVNGISSIHAIVVGLAYIGIGVLHNTYWVTIAGLAVVLVFGAFLPWNLVPPHIFLGDVGSYLLGGLTASLSVACALEGVNLIVALAPLSIYWLDTTTTLVRRLLAGKPIFEAHRMHIYQQMTDLNLSHVSVALGVGVFTTVTSVTAILTVSLNHEIILVGVLLLLIEFGFYLMLPSIFKYRLGVEQ